MKHFILISVLIAVGFVNGYSAGKEITLPIKQTLSEGAELKVPIDNSKVKRIVISIQNVLDTESVVYRSEFMAGKERPDNEIGPKTFRTKTLKARITDSSVKRLLDRKKTVLNTANLDELYIKVEKGKVYIEIKEEKKKM